jgi:hypothetical protein
MRKERISFISHHYHLAPNGEKGKENHMGFGSFIGAIIEAAAEASVNSYTPEEKEMIIQVRDLMRRKGKEDAAEELDKVIKDFNLGYTKSSRTTSTFNGSLSAAEYAFELKKMIKSSYGNLDTHISYTGDVVTVSLQIFSRTSAIFKIQNGVYIGKEIEPAAKSPFYTYSRELAEAEEDVVSAVRRLRN